MPETGLSMIRIKAHLRKWIGLYLVAMLGLCFLNHLIYTMTRPGFSDDERLKIMLLNVESQLSDAEYADLSMDLLPKVQAADEDILILEFEQLPALSQEDPTWEMLLTTRLISGYGDIYITDGAGLDMLMQKAACSEENVLYMERCGLTGGEAHLVVMSNGTDVEGAKAVLPVLADALKE